MGYELNTIDASNYKIDTYTTTCTAPLSIGTGISIVDSSVDNKSSSNDNSIKGLSNVGGDAPVYMMKTDTNGNSSIKVINEEPEWELKMNDDEMTYDFIKTLRVPLSFEFKPEIMGLFPAKVEKMIFNPPCTIALWDDGTKTMCKCAKGDRYDRFDGMMVCYFKKFMGEKSVSKLQKDIKDRDKKMVKDGKEETLANEAMKIKSYNRTEPSLSVKLP